MRILITTFGSLGDLYPYLNIANRLVQAGHTVTVATNQQHRLRVEQAGLGFRAIRPHITADAQFMKRSMNEFRGGRFLLRDILFPAVRDSYADLLAAVPGHDVLVTHIVTFAGPLVARATGIPWVSTVLAPISFFSASDPPALVTGTIGLRRRFPRLARIVNTLAQRSTDRWTGPYDSFRNELGQPDAGSPLREAQHSPTRILALFSKYFAPPQPDWPKQTRTTGFPFAPVSTCLPQQVERFLDRGTAPIVFTLGSSAVFDPGNFYEVARQIGRRVLLLAGTHAEAVPPHPDVLAVDYADHSAVFPRASAIVHQGGVGTTAEVLRSGCPSIVVPFSHDQPDNAARLERLGVARIVNRRALSIPRLRRELDLLTSEPRFRKTAEALGGSIRSEDGAGAAAGGILSET